MKSQTSERMRTTGPNMYSHCRLAVGVCLLLFALPGAVGSAAGAESEGVSHLRCEDLVDPVAVAYGGPYVELPATAAGAPAGMCRPMTYPSPIRSRAKGPDRAFAIDSTRAGPRRRGAPDQSAGSSMTKSSVGVPA